MKNNSNGTQRWIAVVVVLLLLFSVAASHAQLTTASVTGTVTDSGGALYPRSADLSGQ